MFQRGWWFLSGQIHVGVSCFPHHWSMHWRENGGRRRGECLDTTLAIGPWQFGLTIWDMRMLSWVLRWLPTKQRGHGFLIGW